ncbi:hypothetical protein FisN_7Lh054 [Fistulifera solaris]|uniref:Peptidase A1 domain-containing protein n=1 Tax=Fistulifera solaris TaxID=1519565 RepID=A0A1Z5JCK6_FISSO|nr:hypothetical protein FisN_7Lh054 [Fistulifera solaris]|eukprot:GAX11686.1 hypothetical protein FisN_7Lh054 [Fistulifera solaris]
MTRLSLSRSKTSLTTDGKETIETMIRARKNQKSRRQAQANADALPLEPCDDDMPLYTVSVTIGTQPFQLVVDTTSTDLWVTSQDCVDCIETPNRYDATNATPLFDNALENMYESVTGGDQVAGLLYKDRVSFTDEIQIPEQGFAVINKMESYYDQACPNQWDGYLGLGPLNEGLTGEGQVEHFATVIKQLHDALPRPIFALHLTGDELSSEILLGGIDRTLYSGCLVWHDVQPLEMGVDILWALKVESSRVGGVELPFVETAQTPGWYCGTRGEASGAMKSVSCDTTVFEFGFGPCDSPVDALVFDIDGVAYYLTEMTTPLSTDEVVEVEDLDSNVDQWCLLTLLPDENLSVWLLGEQFFLSNFVAFDIHENKVGLAPKRIAENDGSPLCADDEDIDIYNGVTMNPNSSPFPTYAPTIDEGYTKSPTPSYFEEEGSSLAPFSSETNFPTETAIPRTTASPAPIPVPTKDPSHQPTLAPHRNVVPPHTSPRSPTIPSENSDNAASVIPLVVGATLFALLAFCLFKERRGQRNYRRAAWSDGYTMGGDLELRAIS